MIRSRVAQRYAGSILELAIDQDAIAAVEADFATLRAAISGSRELHNLLVSPVVDDHRKEQVLKEVFEGKVSDLVLRFVLLLTRKGRSQELSHIVGAFFERLDAHRKITSAIVTSAVELDEEQRVNIESELKRVSGQTIRATYQVDPTLVGGFTARIGDRMIDASVRHQLDRLHETLTQG